MKSVSHKSLSQDFFGSRQKVFADPWSRKSVLNFSHISIKLQADRNILAFPEAGRGNCLPYVLAAPSLFCESGR